MGVVAKIEEKAFKAIQKLPPFALKPAVKIVNFARKKKAFSLKTPINLTLYVTNKCNANCRHCFYKSELNIEKEEISLSQIEKIAKTLKHPLATLMLSGGEPFLRNDIVEVCKIFLKHNKTRRITISTNGM
ncbi:MAG: radical SAM protein, partial [Nanoarchaeota archaeon]|nr:radical SAM protein [Nanoarchaeota archaeon]